MDGVVDVVVPPIGVEPDGVLPLQCSGHVRPLVQRVATSCKRVWGLVWVVRVARVPYEGVLIWVPVPDTGGTAPGSSCRRCTWRRSASQAAFSAFLLYMARANCSSLHAGRDSQYSFSLPKLMIKRLGVGLMSWCGAHPTRV